MIKYDLRWILRKLVATLFVSLIIVHLGVAELPLVSNLEGRQV